MRVLARVLVLARPLLPALTLAAPLGAQLEHPREFPTEASFTATIEALRAGSHDGFEALRGERRDATHWVPVMMEGLTADLSAEPGEERHRLERSAFLDRFLLVYDFESVHAPDDEEAAAMEADFLTLRGWMLAAAGDWDFASSTEDDGLRLFELTRPGAEDARIRLILRRETRGDRRGWWSLGLVALAPLVDVPPLPEPDLDRFRGLPTEAGFGAVVEAMKAGAYEGLEPLKGVEAPREQWGKNAGMRTWSVMPMEGLLPDPDAEVHSMMDLGDRAAATYSLRRVDDPGEEQRAALEDEFRLLRGWLAARSAGWGTAEDFEPWSWTTAESRRFALVPAPGMPVRRLDGQPVPRIELWLRKSELDGGDGGDAGDGGERWSLSLSCEVEGGPRAGDGRADWLVELLAESDPPAELPPLPDDLEETVLALVADAPASFASFRAPGAPRADDLDGYERRLDDPVVLPYGPRWPLTVHLLGTPDPAAVRDHVTEWDDAWGTEVTARLGLLSVHAPNSLTRVAVDAYQEEAVARLAEVLDGWRVRFEDVPGGKEDFHVRLGTLEGVREDGHPVWITVERLSYPVRMPGYPEGETLQLALFVSTDHRGTVGYDLLAQWRAALEEGSEPLATGVRLLGDPLEGRLLEGDRVAPRDGEPIELLTLLGAGGEEEVRLDVVRDGRYRELVVAPPRISLARWRELQADCRAGELDPAALSLAGSRLRTAELVALVRALVEAGGSDFAELPAEHAEWLVRTDVRQKITVAAPLWDAEVAPAPTFVEVLRAGLANTFDGRWIVEPHTENSGPFWDWFARQTHWSARHEGPGGLHPWVELVEGVRGDEVYVELQVSAFSSEHRRANAEHPERLWFQPIGGDCVDGRGVAWCYREGLTFDGPFRDGVPHGTGEHIFADGTAEVGVRYERGRLEYTGRPKPPPEPVIAEVWSDFFLEPEEYTLPSDWLDYWDGAFDPVEVTPPPQPEPDYVYLSTGDARSRTCVGCLGSGEQWYSYEVEEYSDTMLFFGTSLKRQGYDVLRTYEGTRRVSEVGPCSYCSGTGRQRY